MKNNRKSSFLTVAKNTEALIVIDLVIGLDFKVTKVPNGEFTCKPIIGLNRNTPQSPEEAWEVVDEQEEAAKKMNKMMKYHKGDFDYAVIVFKLLKNRIGDTLGSIRSASFHENESGYKTWTFTLYDGNKLSILVDDKAADSIATAA